MAAWRAALEGHEDELRKLLGVSDVVDETAAADRPPSPRALAIEAAFDEALLTKPNHGKRVFRVPETRVRRHAPIGGLLGFVGGFIVAIALGPSATGLASVVLVVTTVTGFVLGRVIGGIRQLYRCATCEAAA